MKVTIQPKTKNWHTPPSRNYSAAPQMRGIGLRAIAALCELAYDKAYVVLLNSYE